MSYQVLARRWRPQIFQEVVGQEHVTRTLINAIRDKRLAHAYLFSGPRGVGKTTVARIFAKAINCEYGEPGVPCNTCSSCVQINQGNSVDVQEIDGASNRRIEEIRELRENIKYLPSSSKYRVYIIDEVHMLTKEAFNALLKTLEEPPSHVKFIFATTEPHKIPMTILSRCQRFDFKRLSTQLIVQHLEKIAKAESIEISKSALFTIAKQAEGSMRDAQSLMDQVISFAGKSVDDKDVINALGILDRSIIFKAVDIIIDSSIKGILKIIDEIYNYGYDIKIFYHFLIEHFRNLMISIVNPDILDIGEDDKLKIKAQADILGMEKIHFILNFLISKEQELMYSHNPRFFVEAVMVRLCSIRELLTFNDIIKKLEQIEKKIFISSNFRQNISEKWEDFRDSDKKGNEEIKREHKRKDWAGFLNFIASKNRVMYNVLKGWELADINDDIIEFKPDNEEFSSSYFGDKDRYELLVRYCREYFGENIIPKLIISNNKSKKKKMFSDKIQEVLNMFQGYMIDEDKAK